MACPKCGSNDWRMASIIHAEGLSTTLSSTDGAGVEAHDSSYVGGAGLGGVVATTRGTQQTKLSVLAAPPIKEHRPATGALVLGVLGFVVGGVIFLLAFIPDRVNSFFQFVGLCGFLVAMLGIPTAGIAAIRVVLTPEISEEFSEKHRQALRDYEKKKMCLRCGMFYIDSDASEGAIESGSTTANSPVVVSSEARPTHKKCPFCAEIILTDAILCKHCHSKI